MANYLNWMGIVLIHFTQQIFLRGVAMLERKNDESENKQYIVRLMGEEYLIRGNDNREYVDTIASYLDDIFKSIASNNPKLNKSQIAVLAALKVADEIHKLRQEYQYLDRLLAEAE
ncbi:cell division protein ZapA [Hydrogenispora ethanolica]|jgi:cell division protein ZapA|uniref:Cell division protein ZapA n=1 Tax=Hydrogenispora ethanolica TaxID=1082276 RepID=A0A4R1R7N3_HYDET|nr:cell division protein ZapA [Hydrogenispora ethanolica]TCL61530.1 cell division protein ZapA [Hydrogenispora ethanolica]